MAISGKKVVVIGGTSGIGFAVAERAAADGAQVVVSSSNKSRVEEAVERLPAGSRGYKADMGVEDEIRELFDRVGEFDHLVYTAGDYLVFKPLSEITLAEARSSFEVRFWGAYAAAKYGAPRLREGGSITLTSGIITVRPAPNLTASASSATAVESLGRNLAVELAPLRVNTVRLGPVGRKPQPGEEHDQAALYKSISEKLLTRRMGTPQEAAATYLYLMDNGFQTGTVLQVDGGYVLV